MASGWAHTLALRSDGAIWGLGFNDYGQLGDGVANGDVPNPYPTKVNLPVQATAVAAGFAHSGAIDTDGYAWTWGWNGLRPARRWRDRRTLDTMADGCP